MSHAGDLAYLRDKMGAAFEDLISDWVVQLCELEAEREAGGSGNAEIRITQHVKASSVVDTYLQPRPIRYRSKSA